MRQADIHIAFEGKDISKDIAPYLKSFSYADASGKADDLQITLEDRAGLWAGDWFPEKGSHIKAEIVCSGWGSSGTASLSCGTFEVDDITLNGPPSVVTLKAISSLTSRAIKAELKERTWEAISLKQLAEGIAGEHGLSLFYSTEKPDIRYQKLRQSKESDLALLMRLCKDAGFNLKLAEEKLILFEGKSFEAKPPVATIEKGHSEILSYSFNTKSHNIYRACTVHYSDPEKKEEASYTFTPDKGPQTGQTLVVNKRVESLAEAERLAVASLRRKNRHEEKGTLSLVGNPMLVAGLNITVAGFGRFDGTWFIDEARHSQNAGYKTDLTIRKVLDY